MKRNLRKLLAVCLALALVLPLGVFAGAASPYSVKVSANAVTFLQNGYAVGTYQAKNNNITLQKDSDGDLLVCFTTSQGRYIGVTLGSQTAVTFSGSIGVFTLDKSFTGSVTATAAIGTLKVGGAATVNLQKGGSIKSASLSNAKSKLNVAAGATVTTATAAAKTSVTGSGTVGTFKVGGKVVSVSKDSGSSSTPGNTSGSSVKLTAKAITAKNGTTLGELTSTLKANVKAYDRSTNRALSGTVSWADDDDTQVTRKSSFNYYFLPSDSKYATTRGSIKINVTGSSSTTSSGGLKIKTSTLYAAKGDTLDDLEDQLPDVVTITDKYGDEVSGDFDWVKSGSTKVKTNTTYQFEFDPDDSDYKDVKGTVKVVIDSSKTSSTTTTVGKLKVKTTPLKANSGDTLKDLEDQLEDNVKVYDRDGDRVYGKVSWSSNRSREVQNNQSYSFDFSPDDNDYKDISSTIKVTVTTTSASGSGTSGKLRYTATAINAAKGDELEDLEDQLEDNVKVYNKSTGKRVYGEVEWVDDEDTEVTKTKSYKFRFEPDSSSYSRFTAQIQVKVGSSSSSSSKLTFRNDKIKADYNDRLYSLNSDLEDSVHAYNSSGSRVSGEVEWVDDSTRVKKTGSYKFVFKPDSSRYQKTTGSITVVVDGDDDDGDGELDLDIDDIEADYNVTLKSLLSDLRHAVEVTDSDTGRDVSGTFAWVEGSTTRVKRSGYHQFKFTPSSSKYSSVKDEIYIEVDD